MEKANIHALQKKAEVEHPTSNPLSRWRQRQTIKRQYAAQKAGRSTVEGSARAAKEAAKKSEQAAAFVARHRKEFTAVLGILLILAFLLNAVSSCSMMVEGIGAGIAAGSYAAADDDIVGAEAAYCAMEQAFFPTEAQQIAYIAEAESAEIAPSAFSIPQEYIDQFLRVGSNTQNHRTRIAIEYSKQQPMDYLVDFLEKTYHDGYGLQFGTTKVCAWYAEDGMHLAYGSAARYARNAQILSWEDVSVRIGELLEQGQFATNVELAECGTFEKRQLAEQLWYQ